jgi:hypothetical protein
MQHTPTYADWLAKGLILLADIYEVRADYFQARTTLESVINNYEGKQEILDEAKRNLEELNQLENEQFDQAAPEPEEIDLGASPDSEEPEETEEQGTEPETEEAAPQTEESEEPETEEPQGEEKTEEGGGQEQPAPSEEENELNENPKND